jgi:glycosyltransferase involved in cell wall biosynthesis
MSDRPLVSILTPSFNQAKWLEDNLRSVAKQSYPVVEHIVMDGGSTDGSIEILASSGPRVRWQTESDRGQSHAINKAFQASSGEIIGWLNSDDAYFGIDAVSSAVAAFQQDSSIAVVYGHAALVNASGLILQMIWVPPFNRKLLRKQNFIIQPATFIRRDAASDFLVREEYQYCMDRELWVRLADNHRFHRIDKLLAIDRHHPYRKVNTRSDLAEADAVRLYNDHGIRDDAGSLRRARLMRVVSRINGVRLVPHYRHPLAFTASPTSAGALLRRQLTQRRAQMDVGMPSESRR